VFAPAPWFASGSVELVESMASRPRRLEPGTVARVDQLLERLRALAEVGERECSELGAQAPSAQAVASEPAEVDVVARWQEFQRSWLERLAAAARDLPAADAASPRDYVLALERATSALAALREAASGVGLSPVPLPGQWQPRFAAARGEIDKAHEHLSRLP